MADADPSRDSMSSDPSPPAPMKGTGAISDARMALLFMVMLVTAAGNTAMQSVMPSIGTALGRERCVDQPRV